MATSTQFPLEIILLIVDRVDPKDLFACSLINRAFYTAANPLLWRSPRLRADGATKKFLHQLEESKHYLGQLVRQLDLYTCSFWTNTRLLRLLEHVGSTLEVLNIHQATHITDTSIHQIPQYCRRLQSLYLSKSHVTNHSMVALGQYGHHLRQLELNQCPRLSWPLFRALRRCPLKKLVVNVGHLTGMDSTELVSKAARNLTRLHRLTDLRLINVSAEFIQQLSAAATATAATATIAATNSTSACWPHLTYLTLIGSHDIHGAMDDDMTQLIALHHGMTHLRLHGIGISDTSLDIIGRYLSSSLIYLDISYQALVTGMGVRRLVLQCPLLCGINLQHSSVDAAAFPEIGDGDRYIDAGNRSRIFWLDQNAMKLIRCSPGSINNNINSSSRGGDENSNNDDDDSED